MGDIAAVFHWSVREMSDMELDDLMGWRAQAIERYRDMNGTE